MQPVEERLCQCRKELRKLGACPDDPETPSGRKLPPEVLLEVYESMLRFERMYRSAKNG